MHCRQFSTRTELINSLPHFFTSYCCDKKFDRSKMHVRFVRSAVVLERGVVVYHRILRMCIRVKIVIIVYLADMPARAADFGLFSLTQSSYAAHVKLYTWRLPLAHDPTSASIGALRSLDLISNREARELAALPGDVRRAAAASAWALLAPRYRKEFDAELAKKAEACAAARAKDAHKTLFEQLIRLNLVD